MEVRVCRVLETTLHEVADVKRNLEIIWSDDAFREGIGKGRGRLKVSEGEHRLGDPA